jgi:hypothetical protein
MNVFLEYQVIKSLKNKPLDQIEFDYLSSRQDQIEFVLNKFSNLPKGTITKVRKVANFSSATVNKYFRGKKVTDYAKSKIESALANLNIQFNLSENSKV